MDLHCEFVSLCIIKANGVYLNLSRTFKQDLYCWRSFSLLLLRYLSNWWIASFTHWGIKLQFCAIWISWKQFRLFNLNNGVRLSKKIRIIYRITTFLRCLSSWLCWTCIFILVFMFLIVNSKSVQHTEVYTLRLGQIWKSLHVYLINWINHIQ